MSSVSPTPPSPPDPSSITRVQSAQPAQSGGQSPTTQAATLVAHAHSANKHLENIQALLQNLESSITSSPQSGSKGGLPPK